MSSEESESSARQQMSAEFAAFSGASQSGFLPSPSQLPPPGVVIIGGIALPFVNQTTPPNGIGPGTTAGTYILGPLNGGLPPEGDLVATTGGVSGLTQTDVANIISQAVATAEIDASRDSSASRARARG